MLGNEWATFDQVSYGCANKVEGDFTFYTDRFKAQLSELNRTEISDEEIDLQVARRRLQSVDYVNPYEAERRGASVPFFALTFSYTLEPELEGMPHLDQTFEGKAKAYRDPDDGEWKLTDLSLEDDGMDEYSDLLDQHYQ